MKAFLGSAHRFDGFWGRLATSAFAVAVLCGLVELLAGPLYRLGGWSLGAAIAAMRWATLVALAVAAIALATTFLAAWAKAPRRSLVIAALALVLALTVAAPPLWFHAQSRRLPKIHDISTDTANPPSFVAVLPLREGARNPVDYAPDTATRQRAAYPDIAPLTLAAAPTEALARALGAARALGWDVVSADAAQGRLEATDTTWLFGFKDDIVVRITPTAGGSVVDVRSLSRIGGSDFGTNARRVRAFLHRLQG